MEISGIFVLKLVVYLELSGYFKLVVLDHRIQRKSNKMKKLIIMSILILFSCKNENPKLTANFKDFFYINLNLTETNSLKFSGNDTLYLQKSFSEKPDEHYIVILNRQVKDSLINRINALSFEKYEPNYIGGVNKQVLIICRNKKPEFISIDEKNGSSEIRTFKNWLEKLENELKFIKTKENTHFWNNKNIVPAPPPPKKVNIKFNSNSH